MVFNLKRVWNFFSASGSIWVACLKKHIFNRQGQGGPWSLKNASVFDATRNGSWHLPAARYDDLQRIQIAITEIVPLVSGNGHDLFLWRKSNDSYGPSFSSKNTWEYLRVTAPTVYWHKVIWFKNIPRNTFTAWRALLRRLQTKDRL
ncbi:RNA-directed DNA polymerase (reverse transcriptase)-related family protein [Raphanus sativus]|nr:RNA-directed DNA polymerase (reverse transcriptase)-related family protein [Raphanus sativus]